MGEGIHTLCTYVESEWMSIVKRVMEEPVSMSNYPAYGSVTLMKRPVRIRMQGVVGAGGEKPSATRLRLMKNVQLAFYLLWP